MYLEFFRFQEEPFSNTPNTKFLYLSRQHEEALESLVYGINYRKGFMALIGEIGTGKTTLCRALMERLDANIATSILINPMLSVFELLGAINADFGNGTGAASIKGQIDELNAFLLTRSENGGNAVVIIDEAQNLSVEALEMIRMLSNLETENKKLIQIIFTGQTELAEKLKSPELKQLNQRIGIRYLLGGLNREETTDYIVHRLNKAGGIGRVHFEEKALEEIFDRSQGIPRLINTLCDRALLAAYAEGKRLVSRSMVHEAVLDIEGKLNEAIRN